MLQNNYGIQVIICLNSTYKEFRIAKITKNNTPVQFYLRPIETFLH